MSFLGALLVLLLAVYKAYYLAAASGGSSEFRLLLHVLRNDAQVLGLVLFLAYTRALFQARSRTASLVVASLQSLIVVWYFIDSLVIVALNYRVGVNELIIYFSEITATREGTMLGVVSLLLLAYLVFARVLTFSVTHLGAGFVLSALLLFIPLPASSGLLSYYASPVTFSLKTLWGSQVKGFSDSELQELLAHLPADQKPLDFSERNILIVIVESLSATDSFRTSGLSDLLPEFDSISKEGILFTNYFANYVNTEGGLVALLTGRPPVQYPGSDWNLYESYSTQDSIIARFPSSYEKHFYASSSIRFRGEEEFIRKLGFEELRTLDNEPEFQAAPKFAFKSPADEVLYDFSLRQLRALEAEEKKYLMVLETTSSHLPYQDPLGRAPTEENVWSYVDTELGKFYRALVAEGFFENGILVVTADHRKMSPLSTAESRKYGGSAKYRAALLVVGKGIPGGVVDTRYLQQSDLLRALPSLQKAEHTLSEMVYLVEPYKKPLYAHGYSTTQLVLQSQGNAAKPYVLSHLGKKLEWQQQPPREILTSVERDILRKLARSQWCAEQKELCK